MSAAVEATSEKLLTVSSLSKRFGESLALSGVSFEVKTNEIVGLIGPNGAGKTTLLECVAGLLPRDEGTLEWGGQPDEQLHDYQRLMFYLPDQVLPYAEQYSLHVLQFFADMFGTPRDKLTRAIERLGLNEILGKRVGALSKGYRRRLLLCITLLADQRLLVLDEPFDGLDLRQTRQAMEFLRELKHTGKSLLLSIHQIADAEKICDRFLLLSNGRLLGYGTADELREKVQLPIQSLEEVFLALA